MLQPPHPMADGMERDYFLGKVTEATPAQQEWVETHGVDDPAAAGAPAAAPDRARRRCHARKGSRPMSNAPGTGEAVLFWILGPLAVPGPWADLRRRQSTPPSAWR